MSPTFASLKCAPMNTMPLGSICVGTGSLRGWQNFAFFFTSSLSSRAWRLAENPWQPSGVFSRKWWTPPVKVPSDFARA